MPALLCPSSPITESTEAGMQTSHYYGNSGPIGINDKTGIAYPRDTAHESLTSFGEYAIGGFIGPKVKSDYSKILDGLSNTIAIGELSYKNYPKYRAWSRGLYETGGAVALLDTKNHKFPINIALSNAAIANTFIFNNGGYGSHHPGGAQFGLGDGSVRFFTESIAMPTYLALASRDGGEVVEVP